MWVRVRAWIISLKTLFVNHWRCSVSPSDFQTNFIGWNWVIKSEFRVNFRLPTSLDIENRSVRKGREDTYTLLTVSRGGGGSILPEYNRSLTILYRFLYYKRGERIVAVRCCRASGCAASPFVFIFFIHLISLCCIVRICMCSTRLRWNNHQQRNSNLCVLEGKKKSL